MNQAGRLDIGIIGAGKVGAVLGAAWRSCDHRIIGVSAVSEASQERADTLLPGIPVSPIPEIVAQADLVLLAVPSSVLNELVTGLATLEVWKPGQLVVHTVAEFGIGVLESVRASGAIPLAINPVMPFTGMSLDLQRLPESCFGVTADSAMLPIAQALVVEMGAEPIVIAEADRGTYAAALRDSRQAVVTAEVTAAQELAGLGVENPARILSGWLRGNLENALARGAEAKLENCE